jgi:hypothetical protein
MSQDPPLPPGQRELLRQALADAVYYQDPPLHCRACDALHGLCQECAAGLARARSYLALGRTLGLQEPLTSDAARPKDG